MKTQGASHQQHFFYNELASLTLAKLQVTDKEPPTGWPEWPVLKDYKGHNTEARAGFGSTFCLIFSSMKTQSYCFQNNVFLQKFKSLQEILT